jgi:chemotaxis protein MotA
MANPLANEAENIDSIPGVPPQRESKADRGTIFGVLAGIFLIVVAILNGGAPEVFLSLNSALIVFGGTAATTFIAFPSRNIFMMVPVTINAFKPEIYHPSEYVEEIIDLASTYRSGGTKKLESEEQYLNNRLIKSGVAMVVDGYSTREIHEIMDRELSSMIERHNAGQKILRFMGVQAPVFGMCGTLIGLIQMLIHVNNPSTIGPSLATALITTFYGLILANLVITPIVSKLHTRTESETMLYRAIKVGVLGIQEKANPQKIRKNMNALLPPDQQR